MSAREKIGGGRCKCSVSLSSISCSLEVEEREVSGCFFLAGCRPGTYWKSASPDNLYYSSFFVLFCFVLFCFVLLCLSFLHSFVTFESNRGLNDPNHFSFSIRGA